VEALHSSGVGAPRGRQQLNRTGLRLALGTQGESLPLDGSEGSKLNRARMAATPLTLRNHVQHEFLSASVELPLRESAAFGFQSSHLAQLAEEHRAGWRLHLSNLCAYLEQ
jgi:hypothetical protein